MITVRNEIRRAVGALLIVQALTSFGAIALLTRMGPAIGEILEENVYSVRASEEMLAVLARAGSQRMSQQERQAFADGLDRLIAGVSDEREKVILDAIEELHGDALEGDLGAREAVVLALEELSRVNMDAMQRADKNAKALGVAGAWAATLLGMLGFFFSVLAVRRLTQRIVWPLNQLQATAAVSLSGRSHERCRALGFPQELREVGERINALLDEHDAALAHPKSHAVSDRAMLLELLDRLQGPAVLADLEGAIVATNRRALDLMKQSDGPSLGEQVRRVLDPAMSALDEEVRTTALGTCGWLLEWPLDSGLVGEKALDSGASNS